MSPQDRLAAAIIALHQLQTGTLPSEVMVDTGYLARYQRTTVENLKSYISDLNAEIAGCRVRGAIGIYF